MTKTFKVKSTKQLDTIQGEWARNVGTHGNTAKTITREANKLTIVTNENNTLTFVIPEYPTANDLISGLCRLGVL